MFNLKRALIKHGPLAQRTEHPTFNRRVPGSSPGRPTLRTIAWLADEVLDRIPRREEGRWYRYGYWGCQSGISDHWMSERH